MTLLEPVKEETSLGSPKTTYREVGERWCQQLKFLGGDDEAFPNRQAFSRRDLLLRRDALTRFVTTEWRLKYEERTMLIVSAEHEPEDGSLLLRCERAEE